MNVLNYNFYERLKNDYKTHKRLFVAFDFDNTVFDYHNQGIDYIEIIELLRLCKELDFILILFTASEGQGLENAKSYLQKKDIPYDLINENPIKNTRKPYYNILLDDRAGLKEAYTHLKKLTDEIRNQKI